MLSSTAIAKWGTNVRRYPVRVSTRVQRPPHLTITSDRDDSPWSRSPYTRARTTTSDTETRFLRKPKRSVRSLVPTTNLGLQVSPPTRLPSDSKATYALRLPPGHCKMVRVPSKEVEASRSLHHDKPKRRLQGIRNGPPARTCQALQNSSPSPHQASIIAIPKDC